MSKFFIITIGSNGFILTFRSKNRIFVSKYYESLTDNNKTEILELLNNNRFCPIYILLDNIGQNYNKKTFPNINIFDLRKVVDRKFNYEIPKNDLKDKRFLGFNKREKQYEYMFISSPIDEFLKDWLDLIDDIQNILNGIYMLPLETESIIRCFKKFGLIGDKKEKSKTKFKFLSKTEKNKEKKIKFVLLIIQNRTSGLREIAFANGKLVFTRAIMQDNNDNKAFIEQFKDNILITIEYLRRFFQDFDIKDLKVLTITSKDRYDLIVKSTLKGLDIISYPIENITKIMGMTKVLSTSENGISNLDLFLQEIIYKNKKIVSFSTKEMKTLASLSFFINLASKLIKLAFVSLIVTFIFFAFLFFKNKSSIDNLKLELNKNTEIFQNRKKKEFGTEIKNLDEIIDLSSIYIDINSLYINPFDFLKKFSSVIGDNILINTIKWSRRGFVKNIFLNKHKSIYEIDAILVNKSGKIDDLFRIYENLDKIIKNSIIDYNVTISELPKNINFNDNYFSFPVKIDIIEI